MLITVIMCVSQFAVIRGLIVVRQCVLLYICINVCLHEFDSTLTLCAVE